jgi:hypothetical protein
MTDKERIAQMERQLDISFEFIKRVLQSDNYCPHYLDLNSVSEKECEQNVPCDTCIIKSIKEVE